MSSGSLRPVSVRTSPIRRTSSPPTLPGGDVIEQQRRVRGAPPVRRTPRPTPVRLPQILQERVQQQLVDLVGLLPVAPAGGEALGETEEGDRLPGRQILLAHEPVVVATEYRHPTGDGSPEDHPRHGTTDQPEQHLRDDADRVAAGGQRLRRTRALAVAQPADQGSAAVVGVDAQAQALLHQPVGERVVPEAESSGAEGLQGELPVQLTQQGRHVPRTRRHVGVQHGVRDPPPGALAEEPAQRHHQIRGVGADQPQQRQPAVTAAGSPQQPGEQREQLQSAGRQPLSTGG
ncbi:hypothetical protein ACQP0U_23405 [Micromonospora sp. CA-269861]|uniref:hypothetical protein n=1 Tax=Micromonospora sp. CA-269861 TaxID=3239968 RepID=UPI003D8B64FA